MSAAKYTRQKIYNQRSRQKQARIKRFSRELDAAVGALEKLPKCPDCIGSVECDHTAARKKLSAEADMARAQLAEADH